MKPGFLGFLANTEGGEEGQRLMTADWGLITAAGEAYGSDGGLTTGAGKAYDSGRGADYSGRGSL